MARRGVVVVRIVQREHHLDEGPRRQHRDARQGDVCALEEAVHVLDHDQLAGDRDQAGDSRDDDEHEDHALTVVLQLRAMAHPVRRRADHHDRREQHVEAGARVPCDEPARHGMAGHGHGHEEADEDRRTRRDEEPRPRVHLTHDPVALPVHSLPCVHAVPSQKELGVWRGAIARVTCFSSHERLSQDQGIRRMALSSLCIRYRRCRRPRPRPRRREACCPRSAGARTPFRQALRWRDETHGRRRRPR